MLVQRPIPREISDCFCRIPVFVYHVLYAIYHRPYTIYCIQYYLLHTIYRLGSLNMRSMNLLLASTWPRALFQGVAPLRLHGAEVLPHVRSLKDQMNHKIGAIYHTNINPMGYACIPLYVCIYIYNCGHLPYPSLVHFVLKEGGRVLHGALAWTTFCILGCCSGT